MECDVAENVRDLNGCERTKQERWEKELSERLLCRSSRSKGREISIVFAPFQACGRFHPCNLVLISAYMYVEGPHLV